jgi:hypothetical protein
MIEIHLTRSPRETAAMIMIQLIRFTTTNPMPKLHNHMRIIPEKMIIRNNAIIHCRIKSGSAAKTYSAQSRQQIYWLHNRITISMPRQFLQSAAPA